jgi:hypothetical protein
VRPDGTVKVPISLAKASAVRLAAAGAVTDDHVASHTTAGGVLSHRCAHEPEQARQSRRQTQRHLGVRRGFPRDADRRRAFAGEEIDVPPRC